MAFDAEVHRLVLPVRRQNSEDSLASLLSDAETTLMQEESLWAGESEEVM